ncbi:hypothetical protein SAMN05444920_101196 [Nonomuraea solani]|uniref:Uncharacterized protein n=1 Tax=Nonomuraea solani TaxID=1144553 RepID=A0A1H5TEI4_9ACTN|nr:hypothetical protein SAMN05444920_101196 [Nonomuraea solani]
MVLCTFLVRMTPKAVSLNRPTGPTSRARRPRAGAAPVDTSRRAASGHRRTEPLPKAHSVQTPNSGAQRAFERDSITKGSRGPITGWAGPLGARG